jgi:hypothetical protein
MGWWSGIARSSLQAAESGLVLIADATVGCRSGSASVHKRIQGAVVEQVTNLRPADVLLPGAQKGLRVLKTVVG